MDALRKLLLTLLAQIPLLSAIDKWREQIAQHPVAAICIILLYELGVFTIAFGKEVWLRLKPDAAQYVADKISSFFGSFSVGFPGRYKRYVVNEHGIFNVRGLGLINTFTLELERVFVDLRVAPSGNPQRATSDMIATMEKAGNRPIWEFLRISKDRRSEAMALAVIGPPGCGKTTLLQHVATTLASGGHRRYGFRSYLPILLFLRDHLATILESNPPALAALVENYYGNQSILSLNPPRGWFHRQLKNGKCLILLDGLDEVAGLTQRQAVVSWVDHQIKNYPRCRFVLTARPQGYRDAPLQRAHVLEVQPFNMEQVKKFIENWYVANEILSSGGLDDLRVRQRAARDAQDLLQRLRKAPALSALTVNPLLLTMIAMVHRYHGALPGSRVELYAEICEVLLGRWRHAKGVKDNLNAGQKLVVLRPLAAYMMEHKLRVINADEAANVVAPHLKRVGITGQGVGKFLYDLQHNSGLILEREIGHWSFAHLTFQEYLTATHWLGGKAPVRGWEEFVADSWWHETLRLYAAQGDATPVVQACLHFDNVSTLALAADCLDESRELDPSIRQSTLDRIVSDLESGDYDRSRLAAEVQLSRRIKMLQRIDDERAIDLAYVTCAEYQLFVDDKIQQGEYHQPDHWPDYRFKVGHAQQPIDGLRFEDAVAFCDWLTEREGGGVRYRLPSPEEAKQCRGETTGHRGTWCKNDGEPDLAGLDAPHIRLFLGRVAKLSEASLPALTQLPLAVDRAASKVTRYYNNREHLQTFAIAMDRTIGFELGRDGEGYSFKVPALAISRAYSSKLRLLLQAFRVGRHRFPYRFGSQFGRLLGNLSVTTPVFIFGLILIFFAVLYLVWNSFISPLFILVPIILSVVIYVATDFAKMVDFLRAINLDRAFDRSAQNLRTPDRAFAHDYPQTNNNSAQNADALWRANNLTLVLDLDPALDVYRALDRSMDLPRTRAVDRAAALVNAYSYFRRDIINLRRESDLDTRAVSGILAKVGQMAEHGDITKAKEAVLSLKAESNSDMSAFYDLVGDLLSVLDARTPAEVLKAERRYVLRILEYALIGYGGVSGGQSKSRFLNWFQYRNRVKALRDQQRAMLDLYWWLQIIVGRAEGKKLQWDGIRIVRSLPT